MLAESGNDPAVPGPAIDRFDMEIVEFVLSWAPYGGPPSEECLPLFGMRVDHLEARFRAIVRTGQRHHLGEDERVLLERATTLLDAITCEANEPQEYQHSPPHGRWLMRQGVWRWQ